MNRVREIREQKLISKAELGRRAGVSAVTIDRIEEGKSCRVDTMRKLLLGLGLRLEDKSWVFGDEDTAACAREASLDRESRVRL